MKAIKNPAELARRAQARARGCGKTAKIKVQQVSYPDYTKSVGSK